MSEIFIIRHPDGQTSQVIHSVHREDVCEGQHCVMHNPSFHHMVDWPLYYRDDKGLMERICPHGIGHPDPDSLAFSIAKGQAWQAIHGCDGCCRLDS